MITIVMLLAGCLAFNRLTMPYMPLSLPDALASSKGALSLDQSSTLCPIHARELRSLKVPSARKTITQFHNAAGDIANVFWYNDQGIPFFQAAVPANGYFATLTWEGHAFRALNKDLSMVLLDFKVGRKSFGYGIDRNISIDSTTNNRDVQADLPHLNWEKAREVGFVNRMNVDLDLYFVDQRAEEHLLVSKWAPGAVYYEITYHMHRFRARVYGDVSRRIVKELVIGDIEIPDCELLKKKNNINLEEFEREFVKDMANETHKEDELLIEETVKNDERKMDIVFLTLTMINSSSFYSFSM